MSVIHNANVSHPVHIEQFYCKGKTKHMGSCKIKFQIMHTSQIFENDLQIFPIHLHVLSIYVLPKIKMSYTHQVSCRKTTKSRLVTRKTREMQRARKGVRHECFLRFGSFSAIFSTFQIDFHNSNTTSNLDSY